MDILSFAVDDIFLKEKDFFGILPGFGSVLAKQPVGG
jgi:hypothetical protein